MSGDYYKLADKVVERSKELYNESEKDESLDNLERLANKCVDEAMRELIVSREDKWTLIREACADTNDLYYEGDFRCYHGTPYNEFYNICLHQLIEQTPR